MNTPICDYVNEYAQKAPARFHMPGHKGVPFLGFEDRDITEISGADDLFHPSGIILESEENASRLFGCPTVYSCEGSSLCIRAMLYLAYTEGGCRGRCLAGRNAHKSFLNTAILLDFPIKWLWAGKDYLSCPVTAEQVERAIQEEPEKPFALYLTSPDYLGNQLDLDAIGTVCQRYGVPLLVDNAHGAYLKFLPQSRHPMDFGAALCCDSAHKTLPVLTGGAYLHFRQEAMGQKVKDAMALFGSTSPSYLILQSLDRANPYLETLPQGLLALAPNIAALKGSLLARGFTLAGDELLKLTVRTDLWGYSGEELGSILEKQNIYCEFQDESHIVFMFTPENTRQDFAALRSALEAIPRRESREKILPLCRPEPVLSPRAAAFSRKVTIPVDQAAGRILAAASVSCPPAVPLIMCGERISEELVPVLKALGTEVVTVVE